MTSFDIYFTRKAKDDEKEHYEENGTRMMYDETEFNVLYSPTNGSYAAMFFVELFNLFYDFTKENGFENVKVLGVNEVPFVDTD